MRKKTEYSMYLSSIKEYPWYHIYIHNSVIFKVIYSSTLSSVTIKVLDKKPKGLIKVKDVPEYAMEYGMMKNILRCYKSGNYKKTFKLMRPLVK